jgi:hypothetical protein
VIRIEVDNEADVTRVVAAFTILPVLRGSNYEIFLVSGSGPGGGAGMRRSWREAGQRGAIHPTDWVTDQPADDRSAELQARLDAIIGSGPHTADWRPLPEMPEVKEALHMAGNQPAPTANDVQRVIAETLNDEPEINGGRIDPWHAAEEVMDALRDAGWRIVAVREHGEDEGDSGG